MTPSQKSAREAGLTDDANIRQGKWHRSTSASFVATACMGKRSESIVRRPFDTTVHGRMKLLEGIAEEGIVCRQQPIHHRGRLQNASKKMLICDCYSRQQSLRELVGDLKSRWLHPGRLAQTSSWLHRSFTLMPRRLQPLQPAY